METLKNRYEFTLFFDVENGNPNGDPDAGNMPRIDAETSQGIVTDVCLKRKIRNYVDIACEGKEYYNIYIREKSVLSENRAPAYEDPRVKDEKDTGTKIKNARQWMCDNFFDVRTFGAVMSTKENNCGQVRGPVQINFAKSIDPVMPEELSITRMAVETPQEAKKQGGDNRTIGKKTLIPYGLYRVEGYVSAHFAKNTGFTEQDLEVLWDALINMFDHDHSASRGKVNARKLVVFKHDSMLGNAPAHTLFDLVSVKRNGDDVTPARAFSDYTVTVDTDSAPEGVEVIEML
ncbi:type I-C CRISPR-associated protein Cas7/Csd2 [Chitinivibrio alkaliphilus]|uniref:CRISPR/Cas system-associated RAMP superfamily protein Cas7 n=1 Tax=Chitinivibrio alkaliphilus ACht1 TaxID=1313304 RepID=U7D566_9BACT|nr:type I-C CRISPR-associated protein Cas7/Csd2 [Chitinivibrio alkaliphilus]ERP31664.1 CRISPR/Cas system-associated RAMP superfamily protein Cas7 [Chitinivibrio alkaliphilus ACht1]